MREAFPSLPSGSPTVAHRECRETRHDDRLLLLQPDLDDIGKDLNHNQPTILDKHHPPAVHIRTDHGFHEPISGGCNGIGSKSHSRTGGLTIAAPHRTVTSPTPSAKLRVAQQPPQLPPPQLPQPSTPATTNCAPSTSASYSAANHTSIACAVAAGVLSLKAATTATSGGAVVTGGHIAPPAADVTAPTQSTHNPGPGPSSASGRPQSPPEYAAAHTPGPGAAASATSTFSSTSATNATSSASYVSSASAPSSSSHPGDLEELQTILHFPEEVALRITDAEYQLFYKVPPVKFFRHVILVLQNDKRTAAATAPSAAAAEKSTGGDGDGSDEHSGPTTSAAGSASACPSSAKTKFSVRSLQKRFDEVCSWVTHLIYSQPTHEERRSMFACLLRAAMTCWNIGNFNGAMEITTGLRSPKLKTLIASFTDRGKIAVLEFLSAAIESAEYERALTRGLKMPDCRVVPCFKMFIKDLKEIMTTGNFNLSSPPPIEAFDFGERVSSPPAQHYHVATETTNRKAMHSQFRFSDSRKEGGSANMNPSKVLRRQVYISDYTDGDQYFKTITSSGLMNVDQIYKIQAVMDHIGLCHQHHHSLLKTTTPSLMDYLRNAQLQPRLMNAAAPTYHPELEELEEDYEVEIGNYNPVQPIVHDHGVSLIPISSSQHKIDHHILQLLHHGTTAVLWEPDIPSDRSCYVYLRLERSCGLISWHRPSWRRLHTNHEFNVAVNPEELLPPRQNARPHQCGAGDAEAGGGGQFAALEEGSLDLGTVKEITIGSRNHEYDAELLAAGRRYGLTHIESCVSILYGSALNDNRVLCLMCPPMLCRVWFVCLNWLVRGLKRQQNLADRSMLWLKQQYIQLYYEEAMCSEPLAADAIRAFGGRDWQLRKSTAAPSASSGSAGSLNETAEGFVRRDNSIKFKKKRSVVNLLSQATQNVAMAEGVAEGRDSLRMRNSVGRRERIDVDKMWPHAKHFRIGSITVDTQLDFLDFIALFRSFSLLARRDLRDLFDQLSVMRKSKSRLNSEKSRSAPELCMISGQRRIGLLTRNSSLDTEFTDAQCAQKKCFDAIAASSILYNCAGVDTADMQVITYATLQKFLESRQMEAKSEDEVKAIIKRHEPDRTLRIEGCLSFEGFSRFMMDKDNYAFVNERVIQSSSNMDRPLSQYYIASSHNTYLTGHQLKGESSSELYSQVLLTGCRCVELDCWDGDDGTPVIYHGHTFTTKISFKSVVDAINKSAFVMSPYPIVLSIENHCSLQQQSRMAQIFQQAFGEKLVTKFLFESDYNEESMLPSPAQLKHRILIKNKKLIMDIPYQLVSQSIRNTPQRQQMAQPGRTSSIVSTVSGSSAPEEFSDDEYDDDDEYENFDEKTFNSYFGSVDERNSRHSLSSFSTPSRRIELDDKTKKRSSQIARELSDMVNYIQAIKFRGLNPITTTNCYARQQSQCSVSSGGSSSVVTVGSILKSNTSMPPAMQPQLPTPPAPPPPPAATQSSHPVPSISPANNGQAAAIGSASAGAGNQLIKESSPSSTTSTLESPASSAVVSSNTRKLYQPNVNSPCFQCSSINEANAKKLCRKHPQQLIAHTESQLMRTYPAGLRIDSSNFNPVFFWAFGIQMVALNYQTDDPSMHINTAMFEENGGCGFVCKPDVLWDRSHLMYRRFSPLEKQFDGLHSSQITINIVSGQYVSQMTSLVASTYVEVEMLGIPIDCAKRRTKIIRRNGLNPIWNDTFFFKCMFYDLAFLKFCVHDADTHHILSQRVIPLKCLRPGYRHVRLRSAINKPLSMASLFVYSRVEEESLERVAGDGADQAEEVASSLAAGGKSSHRSATGASNTAAAQLHAMSMVGANIPLRRRMFFLSVYGVVNDEPYTILKITQESITKEVIVQALQKANRLGHNINDYILVEEVRRGWEKKDKDLPPTQRILDMLEKPLQSQGNWRGEGRFILKRIGDDPSSRAWLSSIRSVAERKSLGAGEEGGDHAGAGSFWDDTDSFLVCIYNVSPDIPYAILKVAVSATAQDVLAQSLVKARRMEDPNRFMLVEELEFGGSTSATGSGGSSTTTQQRHVPEDENVYRTQANWKTIGRFVLIEKGAATPSMSRHRLAIDKIRGLSIGRAAVLNTASKAPIQVALSDPVQSTRSRIRGLRLSGNSNTATTADASAAAGSAAAAASATKSSGSSAAAAAGGSAATSAGSSGSPSTSHMARGIFRGKGNSEKETPTSSPRQKQREVHSEGETLSDEESRDRADILSTVSRIKKMSMKKLKSWKS